MGRGDESSLDKSSVLIHPLPVFMIKNASKGSIFMALCLYCNKQRFLRAVVQSVVVQWGYALRL